MRLANLRRKIILYGSPIRYLMRDDFLDDRAAGAVHGTLATDGSSTRNLIDTTNQASISGGALQFAGGVAQGDPSYALSANISRAVGRLITCEFSMAQAGRQIRIGFTNTLASPANPAYCYLNINNFTDEVKFVDGGVASAVLFNWAPGTLYKVVFRMLASGFNVFARGGALTDFRLLYSSANANQANQVFVLNNLNAICSFRSVRVPLNLYLGSVATDGSSGEYNWMSKYFKR